MGTITSEYQVQLSPLLPPRWVQLVTTGTGGVYVSQGPSDNTSGIAIFAGTVPNDTYTLRTGPSSNGPWKTEDASYTVAQNPPTGKIHQWGDGWFDVMSPSNTGANGPAKGDNQNIGDATMNGTNAVLTSASNRFVAGDVNKVITVVGAGAAGATLKTTIASYQSAGQITLAANSQTAVAGSANWGTNDTLAIQAAINAAANSPVVTTGGVVGGVCYLPSGYYWVTATLTIPSRVRLLGAGIAGTSEAGTPVIAQGTTFITMPVGTNLDLMKNADQVNGNSEIEIAALKLDGTGSQAAGNKILNLNKVWRSRIHDCGIRNAETTNRYGIYMSNDCEELLIRDLFMEGAGLYGTSCNAILVDHVEVAVSPTVEGIRFDGPAHSIQIRDCMSYLSLIGIKFYNQVSDSSIIGNHVWNNRQDGILVDLGCKYNTISGNVSKDNSVAGQGTWYGIRLADTIATPCTDNTVTANTVFDDQGAGQNQNGIAIGDDCDYNAVVGNAVRTNKTTNLSVGTGTHNQVGKNIGYNPVGTIAPPAFPATTVAVTNGKGVDVEAFITNGAGAITQIAIGGTNTNMQIAASGWAAIRIPAGQTIAFTYASGAPAWTWMGD